MNRFCVTLLLRLEKTKLFVYLGLEMLCKELCTVTTTATEYLQLQ